MFGIKVMNEYFTKLWNMKTNAIQPQSMFSITVTKWISPFLKVNIPIYGNYSSGSIKAICHKRIKFPYLLNVCGYEGTHYCVQLHYSYKLNETFRYPSNSSAWWPLYRGVKLKSTLLSFHTLSKRENYYYSDKSKNCTGTEQCQAEIQRILLYVIWHLL